jgi:hypothetical protein
MPLGTDYQRANERAENSCLQWGSYGTEESSMMNPIAHAESSDTLRASCRVHRASERPLCVTTIPIPPAPHGRKITIYLG